MHYMANNSAPNSGGSIILVASTSGYFGATGVAGYVTSKHGVVGLLRSAQLVAERSNIRVNAVAPFVTPTNITASFADSWKRTGFEINTPENVAAVIAHVSLDQTQQGKCTLVCRSRALLSFLCCN
jgi:NAD(P)-dependent dehydrogenase (short-subunit alcohol dehydrogenase family)